MISAASRTVLVAAVACFALVSTARAGELWTENAKEAMAQAAKEKKDLLIDFTGSDWCGWCIKLDKEVFSEAAFADEAVKSFVFLKLDFPRKKELPEETKKQNAEWQAKFGIGGFPTIVLADAQGRGYARTGYRQGGAEAYLKHLTELRAVREKRDAALAKADGAQGVERAKLLDAALATMDRDTAMGGYGELIAEILKLDADGKAGLKAKYEGAVAMKKFDAALQSGKVDEALALADETLKTVGAAGEEAQKVLFIKGVILFRKGDKAACQKNFEEALKAAPDSKMAGQIKKAIEQVSKEDKKE